MTAIEAALLKVGDVIETTCGEGGRFVVTHVSSARTSDAGTSFDQAISGRSEKYPKGATVVFVLDGSARTDHELSFWKRAPKFKEGDRVLFRSRVASVRGLRLDYPVSAISWAGGKSVVAEGTRPEWHYLLSGWTREVKEDKLSQV